MDVEGDVLLVGVRAYINGDGVQWGSRGKEALRALRINGPSVVCQSG